MAEETPSERRERIRRREEERLARKDAEHAEWLAGHPDRAPLLALNLASETFVAEDGYPSVAVHTNRDAVDRLLSSDWLAAHDAQVILDYMRTKEQPSIRIENPEDVLPFIQRALADAWDTGAGMTYGDDHGIPNPYDTEATRAPAHQRVRDILLAPSDPRQDAADLAAAAEPPEPYPGKPYPADVERLAEIAGVLAEVVKGGRDNVPIADLRVAAEVMAAAASGRLLPDPKAGCSCGEGTLEDYGMGLTQWFPEYDAACPEHSGNLYDPRTGVWILRPVPTISESKEQS